jgi:mRNA interferase MazF
MVVKGDIILVQFPFTDLSQSKLRPAIILWIDPVGTDVVVCAITSQNLNRLEEGEFLLDITDPDFPSTGLRVASKVRATRIATLDRQLVVRRLGKLSSRSIQTLNTALLEAFRLSN